MAVAYGWKPARTPAACSRSHYPSRSTARPDDDKQAEFIYVASDQVTSQAQKRGATPYDINGVELGHHGAECSFDAFVHKYGLDKDPAMAYMAKVIRGADTDDKTLTPESQGVEALLDGLRHLHYPNDHKQREASRPLLDALYAYCQRKVEAAA